MKPTLSDINIATLAFFWLLFPWYTFPSFYIEPACFILIEVSSWSLHKLMSIASVMPSNHIILCRPLLLPSILLSIRVFQWVSSLHQVAKGLELQLQHQSFQWIFRTDFLWNGLVWSPCSPRVSRVFFNTTVQKHQFFSTQLSLWSNFHMHTWLLKKTYLWLDLCQQSNVSAV